MTVHMNLHDCAHEPVCAATFRTALAPPQLTLRFVVEMLRNLDRTLQPWLVVCLHRMMAAPATWSHPYVGDMENMQRLQQDYEELFMAHGVDLVLQARRGGGGGCSRTMRSCSWLMVWT